MQNVSPNSLMDTQKNKEQKKCRDPKKSADWIRIINIVYVVLMRIFEYQKKQRKRKKRRLTDESEREVGPESFILKFTVNV